MVENQTTIREGALALNEDWKPEIEHIKGSDLLKKKKKKVEGLPPHLRLSAMKKAFAHTNEENALEKRAKENEKARKWLKKDAKKSGYTDIALRASMSKGAGVSEGVADAVLAGTYHQIKTGAKRHKDAVEKKKIKNRKAVPYAALAAEHTPEGTSLNEVASYKEFMKDKEKTQERLAKKISDRKEKDKLFVDIKKKGIKFYDKKGSGRIQGGRKVYD